MTTAFIMIVTPDFFWWETAIDPVDYIFGAMNRRPDGPRPGLTQLTYCYLAMFGDYAKALQNEGTPSKHYYLAEAIGNTSGEKYHRLTRWTVQQGSMVPPITSVSQMTSRA